ncbi:hypothetical protein BT93_L3753 [Corymbia citriodora subsp. variegata]|uniref:S-protein homolog n=1 Tax=Corymbia citriodora subsp. variegata TaxID=360336 RepID=A0A8T0CZL2_CORYI|nr:hypothetical protein BT93_L3753 [Corymbia citriodora subsp. variegata]
MYATMMKILVALIFIYSLLVTSCVEGITGKTYVEINNNLPTGITLRVHCKSGDENLGIHDVTNWWGFSFTPQFFFWGTLYFCSFSWPGRFEWFDIYEQSRDWHYCNECIWRISPNGPCRLSDSSGEFDICYPWNPPTN